MKMKRMEQSEFGLWKNLPKGEGFKMKAAKIEVLVWGIVSIVIVCTGIVSAAAFDGYSDVDITNPSRAGFGKSVANAGDLNGDGYSDLVVGAYGANKAEVYFGGPKFSGSADLAITDHPRERNFGRAVANAGDLNGDGYSDLVVGAYHSNHAFVYFGGPKFDGFSDVEITDHAKETGFGVSVANAGDLNNDGYTDLVIGAYGAKKAFVYYGGPAFDGVSDVEITDHTKGFSFGVAVANTGDLNDDGIADLVIGAYGPKVSCAFVYLGGSDFDGFSDADLTDHTSEVGFGYSVANAGDLNNDGYIDLVVGAYGANKAFVYYGGPAFDGVSDVEITDHTGEESFGRAVANAGDMNGDGYADLVIGAYGAEKAFVYFCGPKFDGSSDLEIADHLGEAGFGDSLATDGDLNGDGYTDLVVGAYLVSKAFVYY
jgi:hypothetical protein